MRIKCAFRWGLFGLTLCPAAIHAEVDGYNQNAQVMIEAAQQLSWPEWTGDNRAYLLVKQETVIAPVAVIFGYADNAVACGALAHALSEPEVRLGTFRCQPIF